MSTSDRDYIIELAKSGRSKCKGLCKDLIPDQSPRLGSLQFGAGRNSTLLVLGFTWRLTTCSRKRDVDSLALLGLCDRTADFQLFGEYPFAAPPSRVLRNVTHDVAGMLPCSTCNCTRFLPHAKRGSIPCSTNFRQSA